MPFYPFQDYLVTLSGPGGTIRFNDHAVSALEGITIEPAKDKGGLTDDEKPTPAPELSAEQLRKIHLYRDFLTSQTHSPDDLPAGEPEPVDGADAKIALDHMTEWLVERPMFEKRTRELRDSIAWEKVARVVPPSRCSRLLAALVIAPLLYAADPKALWLDHILPGWMPDRDREDSLRTFTIRLAARRVRAYSHPKPMNEQVAELVSLALGEAINSSTVRDSTRRR